MAIKNGTKNHETIISTDTQFQVHNAKAFIESILFDYFFSSNVKCLCETLNFCLLACVVCSLALLPNEHFETHSIASFYCHFLPTDCYVYDIKSIESAQSWVVWIHSWHFQHQIHSFTLKNGICSAKNISLPLERGN